VRCAPARGALGPWACEIQIRDVPDDIHATLTDAARAEGLSLSRYLRHDLEHPEGFGRLALSRYPAGRLRSRMWELRHILSAVDATYVALAERTRATSLLTTDERLARTSGIDCVVELI
jgi:predicted nucleic acid-binding protein